MLKVLAIDDNEDNLSVLSLHIKKNFPGSKFYKANNGKKGIEAAEEERPDVILLDIVMPGMDGFEICKVLKNNAALSHIPIIMLTAVKTNSVHKVQALEAGADAFLAKPFETAELIAQVRSMIKLKQSEDMVTETKELSEHIKSVSELELINELEKRAKIEDELREALSFLEFSRKASMNMMEDLKSEIDDRRNAQNELFHSREQMRELNIYLQAVRENERKEIAGEIHDVFGQTLTALKMDLSWILKQLKDPDKEITRKIISMNHLLESTTKSIQKLSTKLRPDILDNLGLGYAVQWQCEEFESRTDIKCNLFMDPEEININEKADIVLFRILQESLTNVSRHSHADTVNIKLTKKNDKVELIINDNGIGISEEDKNDPKSLGLLGISERARSINADLSFTGESGKGTEVKVSVPLINNSEEKKR